MRPPGTTVTRSPLKSTYGREIHVPRLDAAVDEARRARNAEGRLRDVVARVRENALTECRALGSGAVRTDEHAVPARLSHLFHDHPVEPLEHMRPLVRPREDPGLHVRQDGILLQVVT